MNQSELAEALGSDWTQRTVSRIEQGQEITVTQLERLIQVMTPKILLGSLLEHLVSKDFAFLVEQNEINERLKFVETAMDANKEADKQLRILHRIMQGIPEDEAVKTVTTPLAEKLEGFPPEARQALGEMMARMQALSDEDDHGVS